MLIKAHGRWKDDGLSYAGLGGGAEDDEAGWRVFHERVKAYHVGDLEDRNAYRVRVQRNATEASRRARALRKVVKHAQSGRARDA